MKSKLHMLDLRFASLLLKRISFSRDQMRISNSVLTTKELCLKRWLSGPKLYDIRQVYMASSNSHIKPMIVSNWNQTDDNIWWQVHKFNSHAHITSNNKQKRMFAKSLKYKDRDSYIFQKRISRMSKIYLYIYVPRILNFKIRNPQCKH